MGNSANTYAKNYVAEYVGVPAGWLNPYNSSRQKDWETNERECMFLHNIIIIDSEFGSIY